MFKKLLPFVVMVFVSACANMQGTTTSSGDMEMKKTCCEKCECCKSGKCACCGGDSGKMCMKGDKSSMKEGEECPECAKAERESHAHQGKMKK